MFLCSYIIFSIDRHNSSVNIYNTEKRGHSIDRMTPTHSIPRHKDIHNGQRSA